jgi:glycosyltransferase involved in cell wall biosynthesis
MAAASRYLLICVGMTATPPDTPDGRRPVLVYRDRIGVPSEIAFSRRQYLSFRALRPVWVGRRVLPDADQISACHLRIGGVRSLIFRHFGIPPPIDLSAFAPVIHAQFARGGALALPLARAMSARLVITLHGGDVGKNKNWRHTLLARRWPEVIERTYRFVCVSEAVAAMANHRGAPERLLTVLPIGVEVPDNQPADTREKAFLFAGRFVEKKGIAVLADAMRQLRAGGNVTRLICAGDGPLRPVLEALARDVSGIDITGWLSAPALADRMRRSLALIVPSLVAVGGDMEGLPSVVPEAMAAGCMVIGTREGGIAEAVTHEVTGLLVPPDDAAALAAAMHRLSVEDDLRRRLADAAFAYVGERLNAARQSGALEAVLLEAAGG